MSRIEAVLLAAALLLSPGLCLGADADQADRRQPTIRSQPLEPSASRPKASPVPSQSHDPDVLPVYIPPNRGTVLTRVGGASRGGCLPARPL